ncbi:MAG: GNAT family N-acetyltransferase [Brevundimonas sp.]|uniref:GNAT family N-acetyltransferase n=1 Tax=Brevundimonas sp. TaxID=1871086 RepID=UPI0011F78484|nr:GNAT family N-acetyltransferase [Brevundimonas sp.]RZJ16596.1 MAG: GNAT family N-acetyltransferase [Brevundimonas sp.]
MSQKLQVEIVAAEALTPGDIALWRAMAADNPDLGSPYFRPEFTQIAAAVSPGAAVAVFHRGGQVVGFFPHQRRGGAIQPLAAPMNDYHGVIARPGQAPSLNEVAALLNPRRLNVGGWVGEAAGAETRDTLLAVLPDGQFDAWYAERRTAFGKYFKDKERARRSLEAELGPIRVEAGLRDSGLLDRLIDLKRDQYRRTGRHDIFACGWTRDLLHALMASPEGDFGASMAGLWAGDRLCAMEFSLHAGRRYHFWFPTYEPGLARCSPGILLSMDTMRLAGAEGFSEFDYGFAGERYKKYFCNTTLTVGEAVVLRPGLGAGLSRAAVAMINATGAERGERLRTSLRRRWAAIEACETTGLARMKGAAVAAGAAVNKLTRPPVAA